MTRSPHVPMALLLAALFAFTSCGGGADDVSTAPYLFRDSFQIFANPADAGDEVLFVVGFTDQDGDMERAAIALVLETADGDLVPIAEEDLIGADDRPVEIRGTTSGTILFSLIALAEYDDGEFQLVVTDGAGNESNEVAEILDVNAAPD